MRLFLGFEQTVRNLRVVPPPKGSRDNWLRGEILLKCPKCGYVSKETCGFNTDKKLGDKLSKKDKEDFIKMRDKFFHKKDDSEKKIELKEAEPKCVRCRENKFELSRTESLTL